VRTVSDPAARKGVTSPSGTSSTGAADQPTLADIGARVGQDNEALRNLLIDTDRRINAIDDAKNAFRRLSEPISTALRDLAQEKIDNAGLRNALAELRTSYAVLRGEFGALEQRAAELEGDRDSLRRELARVQQDARGLESDKAELISEIAAARAQLEQEEANLAAAEVERAALSAARDEASSEAHTLNGRIEAIRSRAATAEKLLSEARQSLVARAEEVRIAERKTAEATIARNTTQKLVEQLTAARDALEGKTKELERERASLIERSHILSETVKARETALGQAEREIKSLTDRIAEIEVDAGTYRAKAERRIEEFGESLQRERAGFAAARDALDSKRKEFEQARASLIERANKLEDTLAARESALTQAEQRAKSLSERIAEMEADTAAYRSEAERRVEDLNERLARERTEFVGARDALDAKTMELELERTTPIERSDSLAESLKARESALGEAEQKIKSLADHIRDIEVEVAAYRSQAERRIEELNTSLERERVAAREALDGKASEFEQARASLTERSASLAETVKARENALAQAEQKIESLSDRIAAIEADAATYRAEAERRISDLNARLDREREGFAAAHHALDAKLRELELARASLTKRSNAMAGTLWARESALADAEQKVRSLTDHIAQIEIEVGAYRAQAERRIEELNAALDRERFEFAVAQEKSRQAYAQLQGNGPTEPPAQQERTDSDEAFKPAELKGPIVSTSEAIHNSKVLKAKLAKIAEEVLNTAAPALDRSGSAQPHGASESRRPTR
jgi:chromosome segregation ATPase